MSVDFYACDVCGETFPDCGDYVRCDCGGKFCGDGCAHMDYSVYEEIDKLTGADGDGTCVLCRGEEVTDYDLINFLLKHCNLTREKATDLCFKDSQEEDSDEQDA